MRGVIDGVSVIYLKDITEAYPLSSSVWESNPVSNSLVGVSLSIDYQRIWEVLEDFPCGGDQVPDLE